MRFVSEIQNAVDYIESNLTEKIDYSEAAALCYCSKYHFQRVFSALFGFTLGEYIRNRRLTLAGAELAATESRIIDIALKYGYESPDSFCRAFKKFHGILPSEAKNGKKLKSFIRLTPEILSEGKSNVMNYRIEKKPEMIFTGFKRRFSGVAEERFKQEGNFYVSTRTNQYILKGLAHDCDTCYNIMNNFDDDGYDFYIAALLDSWSTENLGEELGEEDAKRFEKIVVPENLYLVCETERSQRPIRYMESLRKTAVADWIISSEYEISDAPELSVYHWFSPKDEKLRHSRYVELWIPIIKKDSSEFY